MSTTKITIDQIPLELVQRAGALRESRRRTLEPSPLIRDVYIDALTIGLNELERKAEGAKRKS